MDPKCCDAHYSFVYMDYKNSFWIDDKGEMITKNNDTKISEIDYVKKEDIDPQRKFRVTVGEGQCIVTEFEKDYDVELKSKELWRASYKDGKIEKTGLMIGNDFTLFKKFSQDMMTEYEYDYDIKQRRITGQKREIYNGYYKNDPKNHYPRSDKKEEHKNESHQVRNTHHIENPYGSTERQLNNLVNNSEGELQRSESQKNRYEIKASDDYKDLWKVSSTVSEICFSNKCLKNDEMVSLTDLPQLRTITIEKSCCMFGKYLTISNLPQLESISIGDFVFFDPTEIVFSSNHVLIR